MNRKILFILKRKQNYSERDYTNAGMSTGLYNSAKYVSEMLDQIKIENKVVVVRDNNDIDREVKAYRPTHVIIEALWVVPEKFEVLQRLHPMVKWIIRTHSETPFIANEGVAMDWVGRYTDYRNVIVACNSIRFLDDARVYIETRNGITENELEEKVIYLPNTYPIDKFKAIQRIDKNKDVIDISCFGAVRPLKNHLTQAIAAIRFAELTNKKLRFHINAGRVEQKGDNVLRNLISLFGSQPKHELVKHDWLTREEFLDLCRQMDIGMQVSFTETFNIVAADHTAEGVPVVVSPEISWASDQLMADPTSSVDIAEKLERAFYYTKEEVAYTRRGLVYFAAESKREWASVFASPKRDTF